jgi:hypothetical protein
LQHKTLKDENTALQRKLSGIKDTSEKEELPWKKEIAILEEHNAEQNRKVVQLLPEIERLKALVQQPQLSSTSVARALSTTDKDKLITQLVQDRDIKEPLVAVGAAVRLRFLETAKETVLSIAIDRDIMTDGNDAAHRGDGSADAALFKLKLIPDNDPESASLFNVLDKISVAEHASSFPKLKECIGLPCDHYCGSTTER